MKIRIILIILIVILNIQNIYTQNKWENTERRTYETPYKIECPDSNNCFVLTRTAKDQKNHQIIYKSKDQGKTWFKLSISEIDYDSSDMSCPDSSNIYLTYRSWDTLFKSTNSGADYFKSNIGKGFNEYIAMYDDKVGVIGMGVIKITKDGWETYKTFRLDSTYGKLLSYSNPVMLNDSIVIVTTDANKKVFILKLNINTLEYELYEVDDSFYSDDLCKANDNIIFICGFSNDIDGGSCRDAIYKSSDGGKNWRRVLDLYNDRKFNENFRNPFGLQQIAFKDSLTGIAVGQFGTIIYTYDGGESWIYEKANPTDLKTPATMMVRYAGSVPIIVTFSGRIFRMIEDNLAPKPEDTLSISGRVWDGNKGQPNIPIIMGYRVTMTDADGYYKFTRLKKGNYVVKAMNKYFDGPNNYYYYKPYDYSPLQYDIDLTSDTSGFDFNATDLRTYHTISGYVVDKDGKGLADIDVRFAVSRLTADGLGLADTITKTDISGKFEFLNIESYKTWDITAYDEKITFSPLKHIVRLYTNDTTDLRFVGSPITNVEDKSKTRSIIISPNPASDYINISLPENMYSNPTLKYGVDNVVENVQIFNMLGVEVIHPVSYAATPQDGNVRIDISHLPAGVYYVRIIGSFGSSSIVEKFVKM